MKRILRPGGRSFSAVVVADRRVLGIMDGASHYDIYQVPHFQLVSAGRAVVVQNTSVYCNRILPGMVFRTRLPAMAGCISRRFRSSPH